MTASARRARLAAARRARGAPASAVHGPARAGRDDRDHALPPRAAPTWRCSPPARARIRASSAPLALHSALGAARSGGRVGGRSRSLGRALAISTRLSPRRGELLLAVPAPAHRPPPRSAGRTPGAGRPARPRAARARLTRPLRRLPRAGPDQEVLPQHARARARHLGAAPARRLPGGGAGARQPAPHRPGGGERGRARAGPDRAALRPAGRRRGHDGRFEHAAHRCSPGAPTRRPATRARSSCPLKPGLRRRRLHRALEGRLGRRPHRLGRDGDRRRPRPPPAPGGDRPRPRRSTGPT